MKVILAGAAVPLLLAGMATVPAFPADRATTASQELSDTVSSLQDSPQGMTSEELFAKLLEHNRLRDLRLEQYSAVRTYEAKNNAGKLHAQDLAACPLSARLSHSQNAVLNVSSVSNTNYQVHQKSGLGSRSPGVFRPRSKCW